MPEIIGAQEHITTDRLLEIRNHARDGRQHQRGANGFEVTHFALPASPHEFMFMLMLNELIARRRAGA